MDNLTAGNPVAHRVRVYYAGTSDVAEGMPLCYEYATTTNWFGGSVSDAGVVSATNTTVEGSHNEGKYIRVVDPTALNLAWFAGVVAKGGWVGKTGGLIPLDIYVPNGAIVPVKTVLAATVVGRTILSINSATLTFGNPTTDAPSYGATAGTIDARPVAIAEETITAAGLVLARLDPNMFVHQGGQVGQELHVGYVGTVNTSVNRMFLDFDQTAGNCQALHYRAKLSGTGTVQASRGIFRFDAMLNFTGGTGQVYGIDVLMDIGTDVTTGYLSPLKATIRTRSADPTLGGAGGYMASCLVLEYIMTATTTGTLSSPPKNGCLIYANTDISGTTPEYLFFADSLLALAVTDDTVAQDDAAAKSILIKLQEVEYHIPIYTDTEIA